MKVIIAGSRNINDYEIVCKAIADSKFSVTEVVSGTAHGVDRLGERWAKERSIPIHRFPADWDRFGKPAGYLRNLLMADFADALVAVWDGNSKGTKHMIDIMKEKNKMVYIGGW